MVLCKFLVPINIKADGVHAEGAGANGDFLADTAQADDADGLVQQFVAGLAFPAATARGVGMKQKIFLQREQQQKRMFGNGGMVDAGREEHGNPEFGAGFHVNLVHADTVLADDFEFGARLFEHLARDGVVAANVAFRVADQRQRVGFIERAAGADDIPAGLGE